MLLVRDMTAYGRCCHNVQSLGDARAATSKVTAVLSGVAACPVLHQAVQRLPGVLQQLRGRQVRGVERLEQAGALLRVHDG